MNPQQLEREYSPSSVIGGNYGPYIREYAIRSEKARAACKRFETMTYGDEPSNSVDIALPKGASGCPLIVYIHGGYWQELSKNESLFGADIFCNRGIAFAAVDYTLAPKAGLSKIVIECRSALETLFVHAGRLGIDQERIFVAGSSAGGHLAAMCCCNTNGRDEAAGNRVSGLILLSGVYELEPLVQTSVNDAVGMTVEEARRNSPLLLDTGPFPDTIVTWGEQETPEFKRQSLALSMKLQSPMRSVQAFESPSRNHFDVVHDMYNPHTKLGQSILELVEERR